MRENEWESENESEKCVRESVNSCSSILRFVLLGRIFHTVVNRQCGVSACHRFSARPTISFDRMCASSMCMYVSFDDDVFFSFLCCSNQQQNTNLIIVYIWFSHSVTVRVCCFVCLLYSLSFPSTFFLIILQIIILTQAAKHDSISAWCNSKQCHCGFLWFLVWNNRKTNRKETTE